MHLPSASGSIGKAQDPIIKDALTAISTRPISDQDFCTIRQACVLKRAKSLSELMSIISAQHNNRDRSG
jgi:hypothetical protein